MPELRCGNCAAPLIGRFCRSCGSDSETIPPAIEDAELPPPPQPLPAPPQPVPARDGDLRPAPAAVSATTFPNVGQLLSQGWSASRQYTADWVANAGLVFGAFVVVGFVNYLYEDSLEPFEEGNAAIELLFLTAFTLVSLAASYGLVRAGLVVTSGGAPHPSDVWRFDRFGPYLVGSLIWSAVLAGAGGATIWLLPVGGFLLIVALFLYWPFLLVDRRAGPVEAMWRSVSMTTHSLRLVAFQALFTLVLATITLAGFALATVAWLVGAASASGDDAAEVFGAILLLTGIAIIVMLVPVVAVATAAAYRFLGEVEAA